MSLLPENTTFTQVIKTEDFTCIEMQTGRPWTYQTDLYCLAATSHCLLFGNYMRVSKVGGRWFITSKLQRYLYLDQIDTLKASKIIRDSRKYIRAQVHEEGCMGAVLHGIIEHRILRQNAGFIEAA